MTLLRKLFRLLSPQERKQILWLLPLLVVAALIEVVGIASVAPFLAIVADPDVIETNEILQSLYRAGGFEDTRSFLIAVGVAMFCFIVASNAVSALSTWTTLRFSWMRNHELALRLLSGYLARPYLFFLERHSADLGKTLLSEVNQAISGVLVPTLQTLARGIGALAILALLVAVDPWLSILAAVVLGGTYGLIYWKVRYDQHQMGHQRLMANQHRFEILSEAFGGIKEIKLLGREPEVIERFGVQSMVFARTTIRNAVVRQLPRFALETVAFGGIVLMVIYLLGTQGSFQSLIPVIGLYVFAGYRLMPSLQQIFNGLTNIRFNAAALEHLLAELPERGAELPRPLDEPPLSLERSIRIRDLTFRYPTAKEVLFRGLDLEIAAGTSVAFVGETGSGKSTLADLILGLLTPDSGGIEVDGVPLEGTTLRRWQRNLGYVPQAIFLADESIARNIAFGLPADEIDMDAVRRAAAAAHIDLFIRQELEQGYDTVVGERGVRLSGGQRQRIGIARALYHDPAVLFFDEATSSLDNVTEEQVLSAVAELAQGRTLVMIAHRLTTVRDCDRIFYLCGGEVIASGTYQELWDTDARFQAFARNADQR